MDHTGFPGTLNPRGGGANPAIKGYGHWLQRFDMARALLAHGLMACLAGCSGESGFNNRELDVNPVEGDAIMELSAQSLIWEDMEPGLTVGFDLLVSSVGELNLHLYESRLTASGGGVFYISEDWRSEKIVAPGNNVTITVTAAFEEDAAAGAVAEGILRIRCNDIDSTLYELPLLATVRDEGADTGPGADTGQDTDAGTP